VAERTSITQVVQLAPESVPGTALAATRLLQSLSIMPDIKVDVNNYRPMGTKYDTLVVPNKEWTAGKVTGPATYGEAVYPLSGILALANGGGPTTAGALVAPAAAPTTVGSTTGGALPAATYTYKYTLVQGTGETPPSPASTPAVTTTGATSSVALSAVAVGAATTTARNIYRSNGGPWLLIGTIPDNVTTTFTDTNQTPLPITPAPAANTTGAATWVFQPSSTVPDVVQTYTMEYGSSVRAERFSFGTWDSYTRSWDRKACTLGGSLIGQQVTDPFTLTPGTTSIENVPVLPRHIDVFLDTSFAALGTTKLLRALTTQVGLASRFGPFWSLNTANSSFAGTVETVPKGTATLKLAADAAGMALLTTLRAGATYFLRILATGAPIYGAVNYSEQWDMAIKLGSPGGIADTDGMVDISWPAMLVHDQGWGRALMVTLINRTFAL
jgi:hypothetical protein